MARLEDVTADRLRRALNRVEEARAAKRLTAAIAHKHGVSQTDLAEWYGVSRRTVHNWLARFEGGESPERAAGDHPREGRPPKLDEDRREQLFTTLREPPAAAGYDAPAWTPTLLQRHLSTVFDVSYSRPSRRRLLREAGLRYRPPGETTGGAHDDTSTSGSTHQGGWVPEER